MEHVAYLPPTADQSGNSDTLRLRTAAADASVGTLVLSGRYFTNQPLTFHQKSVIGAPGTRIDWTGPETSDYMLRINGGFASGYVEHLALYAANRARGILFYYVPYKQVFRHLVTRQTREIAVDLVDCWGSQWEDVQTIEARGIGLRMHRCNQSRGMSHRISGYCCWHRDNTKEKNTELWDYACDHGIAAAQANYGDQYAEAWPDPNDASIIDRSGNYVRTAPENRAPLVCGTSGYSPDRTGNVTLDGLCLEPVVTADYPAISLNAYNATLTRIWLEGGRHRESVIRIPARDTDTSDGLHVRIGQIAFSCLKKPKELVRVIGNSRNLRVYDVRDTNKISDALVILDGGTHQDPRVETWYTNPNTGLRDDRILVTVNGATIERRPTIA